MVGTHQIAVECCCGLYVQWCFPWGCVGSFVLVREKILCETWPPMGQPDETETGEMCVNTLNGRR